MLRLRSEAELDSLGLPPSMLAEVKRQLAPQIPDIGDLAKLTDAELWTRVEQEQANIRRVEKEISERGRYVTAARYRQGVLLRELKPRCGRTFEKECKARKITSQRASEDMRIADLFASEAEAGKVPIHRALAMIKRSDAAYGPYENCFACPQWLRDAIARDYGIPGLDVASSHDMHFGDKFYTPTEDGLQQDWVADCGGKIVWCNPPYNLLVLGQWVEYAWRQSQRGCVVVCMLPFWKTQDWFWRFVKPYAEVRHLGALVILDGFGPKTGKQCGNISGPTGYETIIAIFRKDQKGFTSNWIEPAEGEGPLRLGGGTPIQNGDTARDDVDADDEGIGDSASADRLVTPPSTQQQEDGDAKAADLQNTETPPSLCQWIFERLAAAGVHPQKILDPGSGRGNLTRPFGSGVEAVEYEITRGTDFFEAKDVVCDLVICNPPWKEALRWLQKIVEVVGKHTPIVFICPLSFSTDYKSDPSRRYLESPDAPTLYHVTPLPGDSFVKVYCPAVILWFNLPGIRNVALVPSRYLTNAAEITPAPVLVDGMSESDHEKALWELTIWIESSTLGNQTQRHVRWLWENITKLPGEQLDAYLPLLPEPHLSMWYSLPQTRKSA